MHEIAPGDLDALLAKLRANGVGTFSGFGVHVVLRDVAESAPAQPADPPDVVKRKAREVMRDIARDELVTRFAHTSVEVTEEMVDQAIAGAGLEP